jgi:RNA polymerase sigma-70 factor (ECF subfamily)
MNTTLDTQTFDHTFAECRPLLEQKARRLCRNVADAEDLLQETAIRAYQGFKQSGPPDHPASWMMRIMKNAYIDMQRKSSRRIQPVSLHKDDMEEDRLSELQLDTELENQVMDRMGWEQLFEELKDLHPTALEMFALRFVDGLTCSEIASVTGKTQAAVKSCLFKIITRIRTMHTHGRASGRTQALFTPA